MLSFIILTLATLHAGVHLMGYSRSFSTAGTRIIHQPIPRKMGILWLAVCLLFLAAGVGYLLELDWWHYCGISAIVLSQVLIITDWKEARWGTLINIVLLSVIIWDMVG